MKITKHEVLSSAKLDLDLDGANLDMKAEISDDSRYATVLGDIGDNGMGPTLVNARECDELALFFSEAAKTLRRLFPKEKEEAENEEQRLTNEEWRERLRAENPALKQ